MTTFTTEDRELVELHFRTHPQAQECTITHLSKLSSQPIHTAISEDLHNRIEDSSEELSD